MKTIEQIKAEAEQFCLRHGVRLPVTYYEAWKWRGVGPKTLEQWSRAGLISNAWDGLSTRARNCLREANIITREDAKLRIETGNLHPGFNRPDKRFLRNYGWKTHQEVCRWSGLEVPEKPTPAPKTCPHCGKVI